MKIIILRSKDDYGDEYYMHFEVPDDFRFNVKKFEERFKEIYKYGDVGIAWETAFDQTAKEFGLDKRVFVDEFDLSI